MSDTEEIKVQTDIGSVADAAKTLFQLFTAAIPPEQVRIDRAKQRMPFLASLVDYKIKSLRVKDINRLARQVKKNGYSALEYVKFVNSHPEATPLDSLTAFLIEQKLKD